MVLETMTDWFYIRENMLSWNLITEVNLLEDSSLIVSFIIKKEILLLGPNELFFPCTNRFIGKGIITWNVEERKQTQFYLIFMNPL